MGKITFLKPYVLPNPEMLDAIMIAYPFHIQDGEREFKNFVKFAMSGSLLLEYGRQIWVTDDLTYYDNFIKEMFPFVLDAFRGNPYAESHQLYFSTDNKPFEPKSDWNATNQIEGYQLEF